MRKKINFQQKKKNIFTRTQDRYYTSLNSDIVYYKKRNWKIQTTLLNHVSKITH